MKNKKLFAILTLVCFMFTLMPVAAFAADGYAWINAGEEYVKLDKTSGEATVELHISDTAKTVYVFAMKDGALTDDMYFKNTTRVGFIEVGDTTHSSINGILPLTFTEQGEYTVYLVDKDTYEETLITNSAGDKSLTQIAKELIANSDNMAVMDNNVITVNPSATEYRLSASVDGSNFYLETTQDFTDIVEAGLATVCNGADEEEVWFLLEHKDAANTWVPVKGATLNVDTNSSAVEVSKTEVTTNPKGIAKVNLSSTIAGDFKLYVEYGNKADLTADVTANATSAAVITLKYPGSKVDLDTDLNSTDMMFTITDINGNLIKAANNAAFGGAYYVRVVEAPKASAITNTVLARDAALYYNETEAAWYLSGVELDAEGNYTFKVILDNGASATGSVEVKEFQKPVSIQLAYQAPSVELNGYNYMKQLKFVDANGVKTTKGTNEIKVAATGYAVDTFGKNAANQDTVGAVKAKADEKYVGSTITVTAVSNKYNLVATTSMVVANEAAEVKYASTEADVAVNNTLTANVVDVDGNKVALTNATAADLDIAYVVLEKPEGARVAVSTANAGNLTTKGEFKVSFTASEIGTYKLQTLVTYEQADGVVKYYTGIETITVGNTGFEDIVVMSVGSNEIVVNAETKAIDAAPMISNNRTFVPFRALAEAFGANVAYDEATQSVTAELNGTTVVMTIGSATYTVNGVEKTADVAPFISDSRTMVPVRFVAEEFGIKVTPTYDENGATADILFAK